MASHLAVRPVYRAQLTSKPSNGHVNFIPQIRKIVFEYCEKWPTSENTRTFLANHLERYARTNPHVEFVVKQRNHHEPIVRGFYLNNNEKVICLKGYDLPVVQDKVQLLLDSSGAKMQSLKHRAIVSTTESSRGIWSGFHGKPFRI
ncbi:thioredoxin-like protein [Vararia minispora EC-137]|uniref:Thioredoxin-like protein n=1 Tax=Vararia minispora EC-137 TaxID=1314806 RepID=A0ACB8QPX8_9AGAM|nr:thioredoxin-like protein [Vararia minispora EC-137]